MKYFTEPSGKFIIKIPTEWQYKNILAGFKEESPFSFELYHNPVGAFQISCYSEAEKKINKRVKIQKSDTNNLEFIKARMDDNKFNMHLWYATVEDHMFMAKYIYDAKKAKNPKINRELKKVELALSSLVLIGPEKRKYAMDLDKYDKFMGSLAASFDLKTKALENVSMIELLIIIANQIDAYLRLAIVLQKQINEKSDDIDISLLYQGNNDSPLYERKIYQISFKLGIIDQNIFDELDKLYSERNKIVHRYIISEFKTRHLYEIVIRFETICEKIRLVLKQIEDLQCDMQVGVYKDGKSLPEEISKEDLMILYSRVNDKHLLNGLKRKIEF